MEIIFQLKLLSGHAFFSDLGWNSGQSKFWSYVVPGQNFTRKLILFFLSTILLPSLKRKKNNVFSLSKSMLQRPKKTKIEIKHSNIFTKPLWGGLTLTVPFPQSPQRSFSSVPSICKYHICLLPNDPIKHYYINKRQC